MPNKFEDLTGQRFGRLVVLKQGSSEKGARWWCMCDCGNKTVVRAFNLTNRGTKSCGCLKNELNKKRYCGRKLDFGF